MVIDLDRGAVRLAAASSQLAVVSIVNGSSLERSQLLAFRKSDGTWHHLSEIGTHGSYVRVFGSWVATVETWPKTAPLREHAGIADGKRQNR